MRALRIYLDTSVLGGCFDPEFEIWSNGLMADFRAGLLRAVLSDVTAAEVARAPETVRGLHADLLASGAELVPTTDECLSLLAAYEARRILAPMLRNDMLHIALATVADVDVLVSWNFRHIVRLDNIRLFSAVNIELGYKPLAIYSPQEVSIHGREPGDSSR
ncbi:MAG: PIN domain-containing protein [Deltaproteobacteria bacterium]|nr:PIN domain-containing protein [Deltaproteobacteria bacterium]